MHTGQFSSIAGVLNHYNNLPPIVVQPGVVNSIDPRVRPNGFPQQLNLTSLEIQQLEDFLRTLSGTDVYTNPKWSDPFDANGNLTLLHSPLGIAVAETDLQLEVYPNPFIDYLKIDGDLAGKEIVLYDMRGRTVVSLQPATGSETVETGRWSPGVYMLVVLDQGRKVAMHKVVKR
jgi:cytochrome c peroxidase